jgi:hypothetical protein
MQGPACQTQNVIDFAYQLLTTKQFAFRIELISINKWPIDILMYSIFMPSTRKVVIISYQLQFYYAKDETINIYFYQR